MSSERNDPSRPDDPEPGLDVDAAFADIVAHWSPSPPEPDPDAATPQPEPEPDPEPEPEQKDDQPSQEPPEEPPDDAPPEASRDPDSLRNLFRPSFSDTLDTEATWDDEGHFVPPPPPPLPPVDSRRKIAWYCLFGSPALALLFIALGTAMPGWVLVGMVAAFVGGFSYLVATMGSSSDNSTGGDGAVL